VVAAEDDGDEEAVAAEDPKFDANAEFRPLPMTLLDTDAAVIEILGKEIFYNDTADRVKQPGIATGLAWTAAGGEILFIEASQSAGNGGMKTTGQLGDVMKESASAALSWIKSHAVELGLSDSADEILMADKEIHLHFPAGAVPKDGPSAGVTITTCLVSLLSGRKVRPDIAMTGEISLLGNVLPVGGIKEKLLAAHRAGIKQVFVPARNEQDLADLPEEIRNDLNVKLCSDVRDVLNFAFVDQVDGALSSAVHSQPGASAKL
jgi:ATP-dependent Lon protease